MSKPRWIIQNNLIHENDLNKMQEACTQNNVDYEEVTIIPFSEGLPDFTVGDGNIYYGSTTFMYNVYNQLNKPKGLFFDDKLFTMENYNKQWGDYMLNGDAEITTFEKLLKRKLPDEQEYFIRPNADDKSFDGVVKKFKDIKDWHKSFIQYDNVNLSDQTKILFGEAYNVEKEWRNFIVDGEVVTSSRYRKNFLLSKSNTDIPDDMIDFVNKRCDEYMPHENFIMDIALCGGDYYIIECGCINSAGFYSADINKLISSLSEWMKKSV